MLVCLADLGSISGVQRELFQGVKEHGLRLATPYLRTLFTAFTMP